MSTDPHFRIVLVTAPSIAVGRQLAGAALESRTAACVNLVPNVESHYWWQGKIEQSGEVLLVIKTIRSKVEDLEKVILENHPYDTPEFVALEIPTGNARYLDWLEQSIEGSARQKSTKP